ncbi:MULTISPECIES: hypothetical protein [Streptomyces]|uniref:hypothetical protein n=1 Tax=Streptomyces TaxID=1883 RepID=UPI001E59074F|nr:MULTISPECIES: hypothetical protein [Streptomyces]UFQ16422.1 hypothetical protein J2N69_16215 [Streptomyces huasconensis]WCL86025.1 hypothetical protein PPN52_16220 [Streptomyces sp. JCM 35825]
MATPLVHIWRQREVVTAETMNRYLRDVHKFLYNPPACRVSFRQRGTHSNSNPADAVDRGKWLPFNKWTTIPMYEPGKGPRPTEEYDTTGGAMIKPTGSVLWRLTAPEDGLYSVTFGGIIETNGQPNNVHFRLGRNQLVDGDWTSGYAPFASHCPGAVQHASYASRYDASIHTTIQLKAGETVSAGGVADKDFILGRADMPNRSFLELRWVGRYP